MELASATGRRRLRVQRDLDLKSNGGAEEAVGAIEVAGGDVLREPFPVQGWGTMAVFEAPGGTALAVWESTTAQDEPPEPEVAG